MSAHGEVRVAALVGSVKQASAPPSYSLPTQRGGSPDLAVRTICGWCSAHMSGPDRLVRGVEMLVSHGICRACCAQIETRLS